MTTTTLIVELVIIGYLFFFTIAPIISLLFGINISEVIQNYFSIDFKYQLLIVYVFGIIWNRVCDQIFHLFDWRFIKAKFTTREMYQSSRIKAISSKGENLYSYISNFRSLIRVTRASTVFFLVYVLASPFLYTSISYFQNLTIIKLIIIFLIEIILLISSFYSWFRLEKGYVAIISDSMKDEKWARYKRSYKDDK